MRRRGVLRWASNLHPKTFWGASWFADIPAARGMENGMLVLHCPSADLCRQKLSKLLGKGHTPWPPFLINNSATDRVQGTLSVPPQLDQCAPFPGGEHPTSLRAQSPCVPVSSPSLDGHGCSEGEYGTKQGISCYRLDQADLV